MQSLASACSPPKLLPLESLSGQRLYCEELLSGCRLAGWEELRARRQRYVVQCLGSFGEYMECLALVLAADGVAVMARLLHAWREQPTLLADLLRLLVALLVHRRSVHACCLPLPQCILLFCSALQICWVQHPSAHTMPGIAPCCAQLNFCHYRCSVYMLSDPFQVSVSQMSSFDKTLQIFTVFSDNLQLEGWTIPGMESAHARMPVPAACRCS